MIHQKFLAKFYKILAAITLALGLALVIVAMGAGLTLISYGGATSTAHAAGTINVTTTLDEYDSGSDCSLREAIQSINTNTSFGGCPNPGNAADTIQLEALTYTLSITNKLPFDNSVGSLRLEKSMTIRGAGAGQTVITTTTAFDDSVFQTFSAAPGDTTTIEGLTIQGGESNRGGGVEIILSDLDATAILTDVIIKNNRASSGNGGGIYIQADTSSTVSLNNVTLENNETTASFGSGGGLACRANGGTVVNVNLNEVAIRDNRALDSNGAGGGLLLIGCNATLNNVTLNGNQAGNLGGGILATDYFNNASTIQMTNVTIYDNQAQVSGGGFYLNYANLSGSSLGATATNVTIANNRAVSGSGGNIYNNQATLSLTNTLVANGLAGGSDNNCDGNPAANITSQGNNLDSGNTCGLTASGDITNTNPLLAASLGDNGGSTPTVALLANSPAINAGTNTGCPATDQRGVSRPQDGQCDIGAYEFEFKILYLPLILKN